MRFFPRRAASWRLWWCGPAGYGDAREADSVPAAVLTNRVTIIALALTVAYEAVTRITGGPIRGTVVTPVNGLVVLAYVCALVLVRRGHRRAASMMTIVGALVQIIASSSVLSRDSGLHLYALVAGVLVFLMLTDDEPVERTIVAALSTGVFVVVHLMFTSAGTGVDLSARTLDRLFVMNGVIASVLLYSTALLGRTRLIRQRDAVATEASQMATLAQTDALTQMPNRRRLMDVLSHSASSPQIEYTIALVDLDHFKQVNDVHGHAAGDVVLARIASILMTSIRTSDIVGRWGGEEFILVLPATSLPRARDLLERLRERVAAAVVEYDDAEIRVTVSIGAACAFGAMTYQDAMRTADNRLYLAKVRGRDQVVIADADADADARPPRRDTVPG